jgi:microcystin-dependent protein
MPYEPVLGQIMPVGFPSLIPRGWALCDGSLLAISSNQALFSLFGTRYGGDGRVTFGLPDLRGRAIRGAPTSDTKGKLDGVTAVTLSNSELPAHIHTLSGSTTQGTGRSSTPAGHLFGVSTIQGGTLIFGLAGSGEVPLAPGTNLVPNGGGQPHNNMQPYLVINYMVALQGIFPSRN